MKDMRYITLVYLSSLISSRTKPSYSIHRSLRPSSTTTGCSSQSLSNNKYLSFNNTCTTISPTSNNNSSKW